MAYTTTFSCRQCGLEIHTNKSGSKTRSYCSNRCQMLARQARLLEEWLSTGNAPFTGSQKTHYIKRYLLTQQQHLCAVCLHPNVWNQQSLVFILDHIDGNSDNNGRDNLRMVCPNCDSQLPTFKSKNKGNGRHLRRMRYKNGQSF